MVRVSVHPCGFEAMKLLGQIRDQERVQRATRRGLGLAFVRWAVIIIVGFCVRTVTAAETNAPAALTPEEMFEGGTMSYTNWIEFSAGEFLISGNKARAQQRLRSRGGPFGGIEDFHYQANVATNTTFSIDGRTLLDNDDYKMSLGLVREKFGYLRFSYDKFRTWSSGDGGFDPPSNMWYPLSENALALDREEISFEGGLTLENVPTVTFKYNHRSRDGQKGSTSWGITHPNGVTRGLSPSFYDINEKSDSFQLDVTHKLNRTEFGGGLRYDSGKLDDALNITQSPGEPAFQRKITDRQGTTYDMFSVHAFSETWVTNNLMFSSGLSYSDLNTDFSGSRIYGSDFDVSYAPNALNGFGYFGLNGGSRLHEYVGNLNLFYKPTPNFAIIPSIRVQREDWNASSAGSETLAGLAATDFTSLSERTVLDVRERLDLRYTGITNWVLYARADLTEGDGNLNENGGLVPVNGIGIPPIDRKTEDGRFFQKYSAGARWYPSRRVIIDAGGYYKLNAYDYEHSMDSTINNSADRYPAYLALQDFETYDGNLRLTLRPLTTVTLVSRYELQFSTVHTKPESLSGLGQVESSKMTGHIFAQDVSWIPWSRLCLQAGFNYVLSETRTPASDVTQAILSAQNNYWTMNFSSSLVLDNKTDLRVNYFYYQADNSSENSVAVPYGADAEEHGVTATLTRQITSQMRWTLRYGFFLGRDQLSGGNKNYDAHLLFSSIQYRF
jgi:hypothetical protein